MTQSKRDSSRDDVQGYCYQFWRARNNSYQVNGANGQFVLVMPEKDAVVIFYRRFSGYVGANWIWSGNIYIPQYRIRALPLDEKSSTELKQRLASLALPIPPKNNNEAITSKVSGKTFTFAPNDKHIQSVSLQFKGRSVFTQSENRYRIILIFHFASGRWQPGKTAKHGPSIFAQAKNNQNGLPLFKIDQAYTWIDNATLELSLRYIENVSSEKIVIKFDEIGQKKILFELKSNGSRFNRAAPLRRNDAVVLLFSTEKIIIVQKPAIKISEY